ncbi:MAG: fibronectin type III domain-containing protein, partial [Candidatus Gracilibacteria bacterium]
MNWASSTDTNGISKYYIYRTSTTTPIASTTGLIYGDSGLSAGTSYNYFVKAVDAAGNSSGFATTSGTTLADTTPPSITIITPTVNPTYNASTSPINLSGTATDNLAVSLVTWVNSLTIATGTASSTVASTTNWSITGLNLQAGSNVISVVARDAENNRATATLIVILDSSLPVVSTSTPTSASAVSASQINLSWPSGSDTGGSGLAGYRIYRNSTSSAPIATVASTTTSYSDTGLSASTAYIYYIFAYDNAGNQSANYATSSATTSAAPVTPPSGGGGGGTITPPDTTPPARPSNFKASPADGRITLSWVNPTDSDFGGVLILRTEASTTPVCPTTYNDFKAKEVYRGKAIEKIDIGLN